MRLLVSGGAGLIGSHVVDALREAGYGVRVLDALASPVHRMRPRWLRQDVEYIFGDIRDPHALRAALRDIEIMVHLAAFGGFAPDRARYFDVNVTSYARMLEVIAQYRLPLSRAIVASSQAVYGEGAARCDAHGESVGLTRDIEDLSVGNWSVRCRECAQLTHPVPTREDVICPITPYALSKHFMEEVAKRLGVAQGIGTTILRFGLTFGPRQSLTNPYCGIIPLFARRIVDGQPVLVYEDGLQTRDFIFVRDVASAIVKTIEDERAVGATYNVATGRATAVLDVITELAALARRPANIDFPSWFRVGEVRHLAIDCSRIHTLGWRPCVSLKDGLAEFLEWYRAQPKTPDPLPWGVATMQRHGVIRRTQEAPANTRWGSGVQVPPMAQQQASPR